jgi:ribosomal-protein-alanine N-acetyltransferase
MTRIEPLTVKHLDAVFAIETDSFSVPWTYESLKKELLGNERAHYFAAIDETETAVGYCGLWHIVNEGHITNIAVLEQRRNQGIGTLLVGRLIGLAREKGMIGLTLEVRFNNAAAQKLYFRHGFTVEGIRKEYYKDTKEDALIMWKRLDS